MSVSRRGLIAAGAGLPFAPLSLPARAQPASGAPIRIGVLFDLSGPLAAAGSQACAVGAEIAFDLFNERGGAGGRPAQVVAADSQSRAEVAINEAERLISQEGLDVVMGVFSSAHAMPLAQRFEAQRKLLWITTAISTAVIKGRNFTHVFRPTVHSDQYGEASVQFLLEHSERAMRIAPNNLRVAIIHEDGPYGTGVAAATDTLAKAAGMRVVLHEGYAATAPDLSTLVTKLRRERPDVILHTGYNPDITLFLRQAKAGGLRTRMIIGQGAGYSQIDRLTETFGAEMNHFCNVDPAGTQMLEPEKLTPEVRDLRQVLMQRYEAKTRARDLPTHASTGFNSAWTFLENVLKPAVRDGGGSIAAMIRATQSVDLPVGGTIQGHGLKFYPPGHEMAGQNERSSTVVMQYENARAKVVWPTAIASGPPVLPFPASSPFALRS
ncbi:ABC transporter substrate-binding protein [Roseococcus pinisoli]|uniref:ABC transporter substrate-binding protein n=1 Tax=Roseococcus pinisoli TaxID=2835040 RepID=A0ABS5QJ47_9PROT|nr:ABC transporter substrate-binding protein [Roseococcus pinisoli]MBS7813368.1 ABC transporter substrate-binding protein [Roseococcus pinisoli]